MAIARGEKLPMAKGVASVSAPTVVGNGNLSYVDVIPTTTAQAQATSTLVGFASDHFDHTRRGRNGPTEFTWAE